MAKRRRWTVVFVPHGSEPSKIVEVSYGVIKMAVGGVALGVAAALLVGYATMARTADLSRTSPAAGRRTSRLSQEIGELHGRLSTLSDTLTPHQPARRPDPRARQPRSDRSLRSRPPASAARRWRPRPVLPGDGPAVRESQEIRVDLNALIRRANLLASSFEEAKDSLASHSQRLAATPSIMPTQGWLTSAFSSMREHPILHIARPHEGIDVTAPMGSPIEAPAAGVVTDAGWEIGLRQHRHDRPRLRHRHQVRPLPPSCWSRPASGSPAASASRWSATPASPPARTSTTRCT